MTINDDDDRALRTTMELIADDADPGALTPRLDQLITRYRRRRAIAVTLGVAAVAALAVIVPIAIRHATDPPPASQPGITTAGPTISATTTLGATTSGAPSPQSVGSADTKGAGAVPNATISMPACNEPLPPIPVPDPDMSLTMAASTDGPIWTVAGRNTLDDLVTLWQGPGNVVIIDDHGRLAAEYTQTIQLMSRPLRIPAGGTWHETFPSKTQWAGFCTHSSTMKPGSKPRLNPGKYRAIGISRINHNDHVTAPMPLVVDAAGQISRG